MFRNKKIMLLTAALLILLAAWGSASNTIEMKSVLSGTVSTKQLTIVGANVKEGAVLVMIDSITGPAPAIRATADGTVTEILVKPGDKVRIGDVLVRMTPAAK